MTAAVLVAIVGAAALYLGRQRLLAYTQYFQHEQYDPLRFLKWVAYRSLLDPAVWLAVVCRVIAGTGPTPETAPSADIDSRDSYLVMAFGLTVSSPPSAREVIAALLFVAGAMFLAWFRPYPRPTGEIAPVLADRARRVLRVATGIVFVKLVIGQIPAMMLLSSSILEPYLFLSVLFAFAPLLVVFSHLLVGPYERGLQHTREMDARQQVSEVKPYIVGVAGSGSMSNTTAVLGQVLRIKAPTMAVPAGADTLAGVAHHIRAELRPGHEFMVVEMGAVQASSTRRLCLLTPPSACLITVAGDAALERSGSTAGSVNRIKELTEAVPEGGLVVANADHPAVLAIARAAAGRRVLLYGEAAPEDLDTRLAGVHVTDQGTEFVLRTREREWTCLAPLESRASIQDLAGVFTIATAIGVEPEVIIDGIRRLK